MSAAELAAISRALDALFGGLTSAEPWEAFLLRAREMLDAEFATLILTPPGAVRPGQIVTPGVPAAELERYTANYFRDDPFTGLPEGEVVAYHEFLGARATEDSDYNRWLAEHSTHRVLGVDIRSQSGFEARLRITRTRGVSYRRGEIAALQRLVPHLRNALELYQALEANRSEHAVYSGAIEQLAVGIVVLDHDGRIVRSNAVADAILAQADGIARDQRGLHFASRGDRERLEEALREACSARAEPSSAAPRAILRVERPSGRRAYGVAVHRIAPPDFMRTGSSPALALLISDPERPVLADTAALRQRFGLTPKEAELAGELAAGLSLDEAAARLGVMRNTARSHLRGLFAKTGVSRQGELVGLVYASLPGLGGQET